MNDIVTWLKDHRITEVECIVPDMAGVSRGKIMPADKFASEGSMRLPESVFAQTVTGGYTDRPYELGITNEADIDMEMRPDPDTLRIVPWAKDPTAQVIHDGFYLDGSAVEIAPRYVLKKIVELYKKSGWRPVVAPELEFYLIKPNLDPDYPLEPPVGRSGRPESGSQAFSIDAANEFDPLFEDLYGFCEAQNIEIDTLIHEAGAAQMEINLTHGNPLVLADQAFLFKRTMRETAMRHDVYATFMAKPMEEQPGSAMHIHQSVVDDQTGIIMNDIVTWLKDHRITDNRTVGLRVPHSGPGARRVENRLSSADANPYIAIAVSLACGYLGMKEMLTPTEPLATSAYHLPMELPHGLFAALELLDKNIQLRDILGNKFSAVYSAIKETEVEAFRRVISPWERQFLLLNV